MHDEKHGKESKKRKEKKLKLMIGVINKLGFEFCCYARKVNVKQGGGEIREHERAEWKNPFRQRFKIKI